ncbi:MAG: hypothetical protein KA303_02040 [Paludibacter sp.]|jgi:hypothetical protein|nr:hypothetical protein [Paludibacter sp.]
MTTNIEIGKRIYEAPIIENIRLDNEISLALESAPPAGPDEVLNSTPHFLNNDPFKMNQA